MDWWVYVLGIVIVVILAVIYFAPSAFYPKLDVSNLGPYNLSKTEQIFDANRVRSFEQKGAATVQGFFYVVPLKRTPTALMCNTPGNPSCEDGRFQTCYCGSGDNCDKCQRNGYTPIMKIGDTCYLEILPAPDAGRQGKAMTQLAVRTKTTVDASGNPLTMRSDASGSNTNFTSVFEFLPLPPIPTQKWVMVTISREGRRFDIYYDDKLVLSQKTLYMIATTAPVDGIKVGNPAFNGYAAAFDMSESARNGAEVAARYSQMTDTRGAPLVTLPEELTIKVATSSANAAPGYSIGNMKLPSFCPTGGCFAGPTVRPAQPWLQWETSYA